MKISLKNKLLIPTLIIIILGTVSFAAIAYNRAKRAFTQMIIEEINQVADTTVTGMAAWVEDRRIDINDWSRQQLYKTALQPTFLGNTARTYASRQLKRIKDDYGYYENIVVAAYSGKQMAAAEPGLGRSLDIKTQHRFQNPDSGSSHVSEQVIKSRATNAFVFTISSSIMENGVPGGLLMGILKADTLINRFVSPIQIGENGYAFVFKTDGEIIAGPGTKRILGANILDYAFGRRMMTQAGGGIEYKLHDQDMTAVLRTFDPIGWTIVVCAQTDEILTPVRELRNLYLTISLVIIIFVTIALLFITRSLNRPILSLVEGLEKMGRGELGHRIRLKTNDEIGGIGNAMNQMAMKLEASHEKINTQNQMLIQARDGLEQKVEERTRELKRAEEKYRSIFENAIEGIFRVDDRGRFIHANPAMAKILGFRKPEELTRSVENMFADSGDFDIFMNQITEEEEIIGFETRIRRKDKSICRCSVSAQIIRPQNSKGIYYEGSVLDISERIAKEKAQKEKEAAIAANRLKSEFLANISHEIRTPLNAIIGFCGLLSDMPLNREQRNYTSSITTAGNALLSLINDILDLSKMEAGKLDITPSTVSIPGLVDEIRQLFEPEAREKGLGLRIDIREPFPFCLLLDETRLRQILINLVGNAVKFTDQGQIRITVDQIPSCDSGDKCTLSICVADTGIGIRKRHFSKIFESFEQVDSSIRKKYGGTGLGLPICKRLTAAMGGELKVSSTIDKGSQFTIILKNIVQDSPDDYRDIETPSYPAAATPLDPAGLPFEFKEVLIHRSIPNSRSFDSAIVVNDVMEWAKELKSLSRTHDIRALSDFSNELILCTESFDIQMIRKKMNEFTVLTQLIRDTARHPGR